MVFPMLRVVLQVIRYMEDKLRQRDAMTEKLRLKNTTLKGQLQKVPPRNFVIHCRATNLKSRKKTEASSRLATILCALNQASIEYTTKRT